MIILRQREFAKRDYEGLTDNQRKLLKKERDELAKQLNKTRKFINESYNTAEKTIRNRGMEKSKEKDALDFFKQNRKKNLNLKLNEVKSDAEKSRNKIKNLMSEEEIKAKLGKTPESNTTTPKQTEGIAKKALNKWKRLGKGEKAVIIGVPVAAAAVGTGIAIKKHHDKKKKEQE